MSRFHRASALVGVLIVLSCTAAWASSPPLPAAFYGTATSSGGQPFAAGTPVMALVNGIKYAQTVIRVFNGQSVYTIDVPADDPDTPAVEGGREGDTVAFQVGGLPAQSGAWHTGSVTRLDLSVKLPPTPPVAQDQQVTTDEDTPQNITLLATDANGDRLTYAVVVSPTHGTLSGTPPNLLYTPTRDYNGSDSFRFKANDGTADSNIATVSITIRLVPQAPRLAPIPDQVLDEGTTAQAPVSAISVHGASITLSAGNLPAFATFQDLGNGSGAITLAPRFGDAGVYTGATIRAQAEGLSAGQVFTISVRHVAPVPKAAFTIDKGRNPASRQDGATISASSQWNTNYPPENAIDGNTSSTWCSGQNKIVGESITVRLTGDPLPVVNRILIQPYPGTEAIKGFVLYASTTTTRTVDFTPVYTGTVAQQNTLQEFRFPPQPARYLQLRALSDWGSISDVCVMEFQAWTADRQSGIVSLRDGPPASIVAFSSQNSADLAPANAIDDNPGTAWASANGQPRDQGFTVALGGSRLYTIDRVRIQPRSAGQGPKDFIIRVSNTVTDSAAYTTVFTGTVANDPNTLQEFHFPAVPARFVQFLARNNYGSACCIGVNTFQVLTPGGLNAARLGGVGGFVVAASGPQPSSPPENAIDFSTTSGWTSANGQIKNQWLKIALNGEQSWLIDRVRIIGEAGTNSARNIQVRVSNAGSGDADFTPVLNATVTNDGQPHWFTFPPVPARFVQLFVFDNYGNPNVVTVRDFQVYASEIGGAAVPFVDRSTPAASPLAAWRWDFGDGATSGARYPTHTYAAAGAYTVTLTVTDRAGMTGTVQARYTALASPVPAFTWLPDHPNEGQQMTFTDHSTSACGQILASNWHLSPVADQSGPNISVTFPDNGSYAVRLTATDCALLTADVTQTVSIANVPPVVRLTAGTGWVGDSVTPQSSVSVSPGDAPALVYRWDFGDGTTSANASHAWAAAGAYTVTVTVTDRDGATGSAKALFTIRKRPTLINYLGDRTGQAGQPVLLRAKLRNADNATPLPGKTVRFALGGVAATAVTNQAGVAQATVVFTGTTGFYSATVAFLEDVTHLSSTTSVSFAAPDAYQTLLDQAADDGLGWLVPRQQGNGCWGQIGGEAVAHTGLAVLKLETHAEQRGLDPLAPAYIYHTQVRRGLDCLFTQAKLVSIAAKPAGNPDSDGDGKGVGVSDTGAHPIYNTGITAMALAASAHPELTVTVSSPVQGWTYRRVLANIVDYLAWAQAPATTSGYRGGWSYTPGENRADNSVSGYATLGLVYAESPAPRGFGLTIPRFVKDELAFWVNTVQDTAGGGSGYAGRGGGNMLRTGNLLQQMAFIGRTPLSSTVESALHFQEVHWNDANFDPGWQNDWLTPNIQAAYTTLKGFEALGISRIDTSGSGRRDGDWFVKMTTVILNAQQPDGSWPRDEFGDPDLTTAWALLILEREAPPVTKYNLTVQVSDLSTGSPIISATVAITGAERRTGSTGPGGLARFPDLLVGSYTAGASATGYVAATTAFTLSGSITVPLRLRPVVITGPLVARPGGPYTTTEGSNLVFDGRASSDPNGFPLTYTWHFQDLTFTGITATIRAIDDFTGTLTLTVDNGHGGHDSATTGVTIRNLPPLVAPIADRSMLAGQPLALGPVAFSDPGVRDIHTAQLAWGDGQAGPGALAEIGGSGTVTATHTYTTGGNFTARLCVADQDGGVGCQPFRVTVGQPLPDLTVMRVDRSGLVGDWQGLQISGTVKAVIANLSRTAVTRTFTTMFFIDGDQDGMFEPADDRLLGEVRQDGLAGATAMTVSVPVSSPVPFRDVPIYAWVDSTNVIEESDETNNLGHTGLACGLPGQSQADLTASFLRLDHAPGTAITMTARIGNGGSAAAPKGVAVGFYAGDPGTGGPGIGKTRTTDVLQPGAYADVSIAWQPPAAGNYRIFVVANDPRGGPAVGECDPSNDVISQPLRLGFDAAIAKQASAARVSAGGPLTYTLAIRNAGPYPASGVIVSDTLPAYTTFITASQGATLRAGAVTWPPAGLAAGAGLTYTLSLRVEAALPAGALATTNTAALSAAGDTNPANDRATVVTPLDAGPDLLILKDDGRQVAAPGQLITYTLHYVNHGSRGATGVAISETMPPSTTFAAEASAPGWRCAIGGPDGMPCSLTLGELPTGAQGTITLTVRLSDILPLGRQLVRNVASIADDGRNGPDLNPVDNISRTTTPVNRPPITGDQSLSTPGDTPLHITLTAADDDGDPLTLSLLSMPAHGAISGTPPEVLYTPTAAFSGTDSFTFRANDGRADSAPGTVRIQVLRPRLPDLVIPQMDLRAAHTDFVTRHMTGTVAVRLANQGEAGVQDPFQVTLFEDRDGDGRLSLSADNVLGQAVYTGTLAAGQSVTITIPVSGTTLFVDNLIYGFIDSANAIRESHEDNNYQHSGTQCTVGGQPAVDISASWLEPDTSKLPNAMLLRARIGNGGAVAAPAGVPAVFYMGDPAHGGYPVCRAATSEPLAPGGYEDVTCTWPKPGYGPFNLWVLANEDAQGQSVAADCNLKNDDPPARPSLVLLVGLAKLWLRVAR